MTWTTPSRWHLLKTRPLNELRSDLSLQPLVWALHARRARQRTQRAIGDFFSGCFLRGAKYKISRGVCCCSTRCRAVFLLFGFYFLVIILRCTKERTQICCVDNFASESEPCKFEPIIDIVCSYCHHNRMPSISRQIRGESLHSLSVLAAAQHSRWALIYIRKDQHPICS